MKQKILITHWKNRVAPLFDVAREFFVVKAQESKAILDKMLFIEAENFFLRILEIKEISPNVIICGAISKPYYLSLLSINIEVIPFISGEINAVVTAYLEGKLIKRKYIMPGCFRHRGKILRRWIMAGQDGRGQGGGGQGRGQGRGQGGGGRMRGKQDGVCVCPKCGYSEEHLRGSPCYEKMCPKCKTPLVRG